MRAPESGQTLIMFAISMTFVFLSLIALVGDADTLMVRYNQVSAEALLGAQTGATDVDVAALYRQPAVYQLKQDEPDSAVDRCQSIHLAGGDPATHQIHCRPSGTNAVTAEVTWQVTLPIPLFMPTATVKATRTGQAVFGGQQVVGP